MLKGVAISSRPEIQPPHTPEPDAEEKAAADLDAMLPFGDTLIEELEGIEGRNEKRGHVKEVWSAKVIVATCIKPFLAIPPPPN